MIDFLGKNVTFFEALVVEKINERSNFKWDYIINVLRKFQFFSTTVIRLFQSESHHVTSRHVRSRHIMLCYVWLDLSDYAKMGPPIGTNVSLSGGISVFFMTRYIAAKYITLKNADQIFLDGGRGGLEDVSKPPPPPNIR